MRDELIFEGTYEASAYTLQLFLDLMEQMPAGEPYGPLRRAAQSLLVVSSGVATRAGLSAYALSHIMPHTRVTSALLENGVEQGQRIVLTASDLRSLGVNPDELEPFLYRPVDSEHVRDEYLGYSTLQRYPLLLIKDRYYLALPAAVSIAIRRAVVELCVSLGVEHTLYRAYTSVIAEFFTDFTVLGGTAAPRLPFQEKERIFVADLFQYVDDGRLLHLCFAVDDFQNYEATGTVHLEEEPSRFAPLIEESITSAHREFAARPGFKDGVSVIVGCPWGRPFALHLGDLGDPRWRVVLISAADLATLSWLPKFRPLDLWRLLDCRDRLKQMNIVVINWSGLLNIYAWLDSLALSDLSRRMPNDWDPDEPFHILIPQNGLLRVRKETAEAWNVHHAITWDGRDVQVRREQPHSYSPYSESPPLYVSIDDSRAGRFVAVFETEHRAWWTTIDTPNGLDPAARYRLWHASGVWIGKAAPVLERALPSLPERPLAWISRFEDGDSNEADAALSDRNRARALLLVEVRENVIQVTARPGFLATLKHPTNLAESLLVEGLIRGALLLTGSQTDEEQVELLLKQIVPNPWARDIHHFEAQQYRHVVPPPWTSQPILIHEMDELCARLELGGRLWKPKEVVTVTGTAACCAYLNGVIDSLWAGLRGHLKSYRREPLLNQLVENHESIMAEIDRWLRTARGIISLYSDTPNVGGESALRLARLDAGVLSTRILIEMALCECPESEGAQAGRLDVGRMLVSVMHIHGLGGMSEAIHYGSQPAEIRIRPLGDIDSSSQFDDEIARPYGAALSIRRFLAGAHSYEDQFEDPEREESARPDVDPEFWEAWHEAFGFTIDELRTFMDNLDDEGLRLNQSAFILDLQELAELSGTERLGLESVKKILHALALFPRENWSSAPPGFADRDWYPWRYRRRLSAISRPILQLDVATNPRYLIAPGAVRDGVRKVLDYCFHGGYDAKDFPPGRMRSWIGAAENRRGHAFNLEVVTRLRELGWQAYENLTLTRILNTKLDRNYGDVDVLAWRAGRVLVMECKDLELARTLAEISRQLHEFRGALNRGKPDRLKKHLLRIDALRSRIATVQRFVGSEAPIQIEPWLVFSDLVPMHFSEIATQHDVRLTTIDQLTDL
ncbi:MAG: hypothetical protein WDO56_32655 [Gammaproteobacteria bacterium]